MDATQIDKLAAIEDRHWWFAERRSVLARALRDRQTGGWAADVGAAAGGNVRVLEQLGWRTLAVEYSPVGASRAADRGLRVLRADAPCLPIASGSLGAAICLDVLEHLQDDGQATRELCRVLRPDGVAVVSVPADIGLWSAHDVAVGHLRRYTRPALELLLAQAGLQVDRMWSWNVLMRPLATARRRRSTGSDIDQLPRPLNAALRGVVSLERVLPVGRRRGVSLFAVCSVARD